MRQVTKRLEAGRCERQISIEGCSVQNRHRQDVKTYNGRGKLRRILDTSAHVYEVASGYDRIEFSNSVYDRRAPSLLLFSKH